jgi:hypothetical protein
MKRFLFDFAIGVLLSGMIYIIFKGVSEYRDRHQGGGVDTISLEEHSKIPDSLRSDTVIRVPETFNVQKR